jgi:hypothetical protein
VKNNLEFLTVQYNEHKFVFVPADTYIQKEKFYFIIAKESTLLMAAFKHIAIFCQTTMELQPWKNISGTLTVMYSQKSKLTLPKLNCNSLAIDMMECKEA